MEKNNDGQQVDDIPLGGSALIPPPGNHPPRSYPPPPPPPPVVTADGASEEPEFYFHGQNEGLEEEDIEVPSIPHPPSDPSVVSDEEERLDPWESVRLSTPGDTTQAHCVHAIHSIINTDVYFWNNMGRSFMARGIEKSNNRLFSEAGKRLKPNPVFVKRVGYDEEELGQHHGKWRIIPCDYASLSNHQNQNAIKVAILDVQSAMEEEEEGNSSTKRYVSCRRSFAVTKSSLAEYRSTIGEFETFTMMYVEEDNSFIFLSHNGLFLHYNTKFHTIAFKPCKEKDGNGIPVKGRWSLLNKSDAECRIGEKDAASQIQSTLTMGFL